MCSLFCSFFFFFSFPSSSWPYLYTADLMGGKKGTRSAVVATELLAISFLLYESSVARVVTNKMYILAKMFINFYKN